MALQDDLQNLQFKYNARRSCLVNKILESLLDEDRQALVSALENLNFSAIQICRILKENSIVIGTTTINKHRKKDCACYVLES